MPEYRLFLLGSYPGMIADPTAGYGVEGEVWEVDEAALTQLDELEGTAEGLYARVPAALPAPWSGVETYLYRRPLDGRAELGPRFEG